MEETPFELRFEYANENRQVTIGLGGTGVAILTFLLIFLQGRFSPNSFDDYLYQATLTEVVLSIFFLGVSGSYYYFLIEALERGRPDSGRFLRIADGTFVAGLALLLLEPALILMSVQIYAVGVIALALWGISLLIIGRGRAELARPPAIA